jgi:signal transduction histidine kinase
MAGVAYVVFDVLSESRMRSGTLTGALADAHTVVDHFLPVLAGALFGVCVHYLRLRAKLAAAEEGASRAEALRERLQRVERDQAVWVLAAAVLHELNNPLHALGLLLDELAEGEQDERVRADLIPRARAQADRVLSQLEMLRSMRDVTEPEFERVLLNDVAGALASDVGSLAAEHGLVVCVVAGDRVLANADPVYVRTILENLVDNSLHALHRSAGGLIKIELRADGGRAIIRVSDDGPPLDADVRAVLFEPLRTTKTQGLGLGLPIARALARAMRGDLCFEDGGEKAFRLELPLGDPS